MGKVLISSAILIILSLPSFLGLGDEFILLFLAAFCVSGYFADEGKVIFARELLVVRNLMAIIVGFGIGIFTLLSTSDFEWVLGICLPFGLISLIGKRKYVLWASVWVLFALVLAKGFDILVAEDTITDPLSPAHICIPVLAIRFLDIVEVIFSDRSIVREFK
jgi:hypothetical protein